MKITSKLLSLIIVITIGLSACKKDSSVNEENGPQTLTLKNITFKNGVKIYTKKGEITDPAVIAKAIVSTGMDLIIHPSNTKDSVIFLNNTAFKMGPDVYSFNKTGDQFLFISPYYKSLPTDGSSVMMIKFYKFTGLDKEDSNGEIGYNRQFVGYGDTNAIKLSGLDICYLKRDEHTGKIDKRIVQFAKNEFDINSISKLGTRDTLAIREYNYNYAK